MKFESIVNFVDTGFITEKTQEHRKQIIAMDGLFCEADDQFRQQMEDEEHQQHEEGE